MVVVVAISMCAVIVNANWSDLPELSSKPTHGEDSLGREAVFIGSMALVGTSLFGPAFALRYGAIRTSDSRNYKTGAAVMSISAFLLAGTYMILATAMCCNDPGPLLPWFAIPSITLMASFWYGYGHATAPN